MFTFLSICSVTFWIFVLSHKSERERPPASPNSLTLTHLHNTHRGIKKKRNMSRNIFLSSGFSGFFFITRLRLCFILSVKSFCWSLLCIPLSIKHHVFRLHLLIWPSSFHLISDLTSGQPLSCCQAELAHSLSQPGIDQILSASVPTGDIS